MNTPLLPRPIIALTFQFLKFHKGHFFSTYFKYAWWLLILLIITVSGWIYFQNILTPAELIAKNDIKLVQEHMLSLDPKHILMYVGSLAGAVLVMFGLFIFTPIYFLLFSNYNTQFGLKEIYQTIGSRLSRIVVYFFFALILSMVLMMPIAMLTNMLLTTFLGGILLPLLLGGVLLAYIIALIEFLTVNCTIVQAFGYGFKIAFGKIGRFTINFVFLIFISFLLATFLQELVVYVAVNILNVTDENILSQVLLYSTAGMNALFVVLVSTIQLYASIGYHEFESENKNATSPNDTSDNSNME